MNLMGPLASCRRSGTFQLGQLHGCPGFDLIEKALEACIIGLLALVLHGANQSIQGACGKLSIKNGQLQIVQNIQDPPRTAEGLLAALQGARRFLQRQEGVEGGNAGHARQGADSRPC